jgi:rhamnogalacturonyl hydrolase YesR
MTIIDDANRRLSEASASLHIAEARLNGIRDGTYRLVAGDTLEDVKAEVVRCTNILKDANALLLAIYSSNNRVGNSVAFSL